MRDRNDRRRTLRILLTGAMSVLLAATAYLTVRQPRYRKGFPPQIALRRIAQALAMYSQDADVYEPQYPENLGVLLDRGYLLGEDLVCRNSATNIPSNGSKVLAGQTDFIYLHKPYDHYKSDDPIVFTKPPSQGTHPCSVLLADLRTVKTYKGVPEHLQHDTPSDKASDYGHPGRLDTLYDMFRPPTFFVVVSGIVVFVGVFWCFGPTGKTRSELRRFMPPIIPVIVIALVACWVSWVPVHPGPFKYYDLVYQKLLRLFVLFFGTALSLLISLKDRRLGVRILSIISLILCLLFVRLVV